MTYKDDENKEIARKAKIDQQKNIYNKATQNLIQTFECRHVLDYKEDKSAQKSDFNKTSEHRDRLLANTLHHRY